MDDLKNKGAADRNRINLQEPWEVERIRRVADHRRQSRRRCQHIITAMTTSGTIKGRWWLHAAQDAASVAAQARRFAGVSPDHCSATGSTRRSHLTMLRAITSESSRRPKNTVESALASFYGQTIVTMRQFGL